MIAIQQATEKDLPGILEIYNEVIINTTAVYDYEPHTLSMRTAWFDTKQNEGYPVFIAKDGNELAGFSSIGPFRRAAYKHSVENSVYVAAGSRGKGVGRLLLQPLIDASKKLDKHTILAGIDATNQASIRLHQHFQFEEVAHFKEVGYKFGHWLDLKFYQLILL